MSDKQYKTIVILLCVILFLQVISIAQVRRTSHRTYGVVQSIGENVQSIKQKLGI
jgi:hypothetical protein